MYSVNQLTTLGLSFRELKIELFWPDGQSISWTFFHLLQNFVEYGYSGAEVIN